LKRFFQSEAGAAVLWVLAALVLAAGLTPSLYGAGKALAVAAKEGELAAIWEWLGAAAGRARIGRFFSRALVFSALLLLPVLMWRVRVVRAGRQESLVGLVRVGRGLAAAQVVTGFVIAGGMLWGLGLCLSGLGAFAGREEVPGWLVFLRKTAVPAVAASVVEEWIFRGLILGFWLRAARPWIACLGTSGLFAFVHFLTPPEGAVLANPASAMAGFELLWRILGHFADPRFFVADFATLFGIGMILAWARLRTGGLWFSVGLHAGWIAAFKGFNLLYGMVAGHGLRPWGVGGDLRSGILPLLTLALTAGLCHFALRALEVRRASFSRA
jgi:membrane protease YdiL (CAAX protease family)